jgi:undecaprenyl phosphate N,N'-diacetylbacillosamine 1-phosphate transferase
MYKILFKPLLDFLLSLIGLILVSPVFLIVMVLLAFANKGKPFFFQLRPGKNEKYFRIFKFKTMNDQLDNEGNFLPDSQRLTPVGKLIRKTSLDEIPQLINVIKGDMSLIGPRPLLVEYLSVYTDFQKQRHNVKPGITGWAQVNGRNSISWDEKFKYDVWYVNNLSFGLDLKILWLTFYKVIKSDGINQFEQTTMEKFTIKN